MRPSGWNGIADRQRRLGTDMVFDPEPVPATLMDTFLQENVMKSTVLGMAVALLMVGSASADDVPRETLKSIGLGHMQSMSDAEGLEVRGRAVTVFSFSSFNAFVGGTSYGDSDFSQQMHPTQTSTSSWVNFSNAGFSAFSFSFSSASSN